MPEILGVRPNFLGVDWAKPSPCKVRASRSLRHPPENSGLPYEVGPLRTQGILLEQLPQTQDPPTRQNKDEDE